VQARHSDWRQILQGLLQVALVLTALFSLATTVDHWHRLLELFSHFRLQYLGAAVLLTLAFLWLRWAGYVALGVATIALNAWYVLPWYLPIERSAANDSDIRLLNANVLVTNGHFEKLRKLISDIDPDIILMQEVTPAWLQSLDGLKTQYPYRVADARDDPFGIARLSKFPLEAPAVRQSGPRGYPEIIATVVLGKKRLHIIGAHPANPVGNGGYGARNVQLDGIARLAARSPSPLVVAGDLNVSVWSHQYRRLVEESGLRNARRGFGAEPTWPVFFMPAMIPIDHFLVSANIEVTSYRTGPDIGSDHLPIAVTLKIAQ
jgi:endonuclease/exonuclease/phosphatase (EEP) superfamily protein YafD